MRGTIHEGVRCTVPPCTMKHSPVIALDLQSGKIMWTSQVTPKDVYVVGCSPARENCPEKEGPDFDFGNSAILRDSVNG